MDRDRFTITPVNHNPSSSNNNLNNEIGDTFDNSPGIKLKSFSKNRKNSKNNFNPDGGPTTKADRKFSLAQLTKEALPRLDNYRLSKREKKRPSMGELHGEIRDPQDPNQDIESPVPVGGHSIKLGWIVGVMIPCLLNIWGVMLFLRLSWVVAQSGIVFSLFIIGIASVVCVITTLSLSAISTNGEVKGGGVYFIISRSLGPEFGASVGVVFAFANAVAASMNTIGFCDSLNDLLRTNGLKIVDGGINDVRIVGTVTILVLILICCVGMEWESKAQNFLVATIVLAILDFLIGAAIGPQGDEERIAKGFVGFSTSVFEQNLWPDYRYSEKQNQDFFSVFAIYFPSVTGIQAGANISGDLKNPAESIPKGTLLALLLSMVSYAVFAIFAGGAAVRDATGNVSDLVNGTIVGVEFNCTVENPCQYGLQNSYSVMQLMSVWGPLIYAGCFAATISTALTNLLSVPRLVQALGIDQIYPGLIFFSKPYGKHGEPYRGYVLTFFISVGFLLIGELNLIAPLISTFYLASYALINFCTFHAAFVKPLGWRPTFKYYNAWISLIGFIMCVSIMFLMDWISALITFVIIFALYLIVMYRKPNVNWGSTTQAQMYKSALAAAHRLQTVDEHVKNYHPNILVLSGDPKSRPPLIDLAHLITKHNALMITGNVLPVRIGYKNRQALVQEGRKYFQARKIKSFYNVLDGYCFEDGANALIKATGFGKLSPNILLMGFKSDWRQCAKEDVASYFNVLHNAFSLRMAVTILRLPNGLDFSELEQEISTPNGHGGHHNSGYHHSMDNLNNSLKSPTTSEIFHVDSNLNLAGMDSPTHSFTVPQPPPLPNMAKMRMQRLKPPVNADIIYSTRGGSEVPKQVLDELTIFTRKNPKGTIDVWWLYDDGGLTMLLPYIISTRSNWQNSKIRVFALTNKILEQDVEEKNMADLLSKFRINYSSLTMLQGVTDPPNKTTIERHQKLLNGFSDSNYPDCYVTDSEKENLLEKTNRQLRIHELVVNHSSDASLIVMSMPMPRKEAISPPLYMSWLEMLTSDVKCPFLLARGNQTPVLTFYS